MEYEIINQIPNARDLCGSLPHGRASVLSTVGRLKFHIMHRKQDFSLHGVCWYIEL